MSAVPSSVAAVRVAVRRHISGVPAGATVLVACSGGADSLALASATRFEAARRDVHCGLVTVDHGLQEGSAGRAEAVAGWARGAGLSPVLIRKVSTAGLAGGPEAAARDARYGALTATALDCGAAAVLLGHTRDDQAETVLLALARGGGPRGLAGMPECRVIDGVPFLRPLLDVARADTRAACVAEGLAIWDDPHNADPAYARSRVRAALPLLIEALGEGLVGNLARTARLLAADTRALDDLATRLADRAVAADDGLDLDALDGVPEAVRTRVLHSWALRLGAPGGALSARHVDALDALVTRWRGQGPVALPGGIEAMRRDGRLVRAGNDSLKNDPASHGNDGAAEAVRLE